jgi:hypothetical protein
MKRAHLKWDIHSAPVYHMAYFASSKVRTYNTTLSSVPRMRESQLGRRPRYVSEKTSIPYNSSNSPSNAVTLQEGALVKFYLIMKACAVTSVMASFQLLQGQVSWLDCLLCSAVLFGLVACPLLPRPISLCFGLVGWEVHVRLSPHRASFFLGLNHYRVAFDAFWKRH